MITGEPDAGKLACPVRREAARKRTHTRAPRRAAHPTQQAKTHVGLDHYQCRGWRAWHRFTLLAMLALAILAATAAAHHDRHPPEDTLIPISIGELRRLAANPSPTAIRWSLWRRRHQATARRSHYRRHADPATST